MYMKNRNIIIPILLSFFFLVSCDDFLSVLPHDSLNSDNAIETIEDFDKTVLSTYEVMRTEYYSSNFMLTVPDVMSDNLLICSNGRQTWNDFFDFSFNSSTYGTEGFWLYAYKAILFANEVITRLEGENPFVDEDDKKYAEQLLAEALTIRAYVHFDLVRFYGTSYATANDNSLGIPYRKDTRADALPVRETVKQNYVDILADLTTANQLMSVTHNATINYRINKKSLNAILSRVYLTMGDYENAILAGENAIVNDGSDIVTAADYTKVWTTSMNVPEVLFRIVILQTDAQTTNSYGQGAQTNHRPEYVVSKSFFDLFDLDFDIRASQIKEVTYENVNYNAVWKYYGRTGETEKSDIPLLRTSEVYLTLAEAHWYHNNNYTSALNYLNYIRQNRYASFVSLDETGEDLLNAIYLERRLELAFEGHRFFDIKRKSWDVQRDNFGDAFDGSGVPANSTLIPNTSSYYLMVIPQAEINANKNMVQNNY